MKEGYLILLYIFGGLSIIGWCLYGCEAHKRLKLLKNQREQRQYEETYKEII